MASQPIYQFYAELEGYKPKMWRRFQVLGNISVAKLGYIVMSMYEMKASHLLAIEHERQTFTPTGRKGRKTLIERYDILDKEPGMPFAPDGEDATKTKLSQINFEEHTNLLVWYDFGDDWRVILALEEIISDHDLPAKDFPRVLDGKGYGIIEDCGGIGGLEEIAKVFKAKKGEQYKEYKEWLDVDDLDLATFDIDDANLRLKKVPRIYANIYEKRISPTDKEIDFLEREYLKPKAKEKTGGMWLPADMADAIEGKTATETKPATKTKTAAKQPTIRIPAARKELLGKYAEAACNLYGALNTPDFVQFFNHYEETKTNEEESRLALMRLEKANKDVNYYFVDGSADLIIGLDLFPADEDDMRHMAIVLAKQKDKPRYMPAKEEILKFADCEYIDPAKPYDDLKAYIIKNKLGKGKKQLDVDDDILQLYEMIRNDVSPTQLLQYFIDEGYSLENIDKINDFMQQLMKAHNNTRMFENSGHTPNELRELYNELHPPSDEMVIHKPIKPGRNDPCSCGSGKKYKRCCALEQASRTANLTQSECRLFYETWYKLLDYINKKLKIVDYRFSLKYQDY